MGLFDVAKHYAVLDAKADPLGKLNAIVPWVDIQPQPEAVWRRPWADVSEAATGDVCPEISWLGGGAFVR